ncbi:MAG: Crp/Fnr family transcriptional regulator [Acidimicrobiia bacterium]|nr:Crp/Fnr family transcriptional regulator [Acidimicrobiia bacterium]
MSEVLIVDAEIERHVAWLAKSFGRTDYLPLHPADLEALASAGEVVEKYPGTHLFREGADATAAYVIERGQVELYRGSSDDRRVVGRAQTGTVLGDIAMFRGEPYISSARAVDAVTAFRFDRDKLLPVLFRRPVITLRWLVAGLSQLESTQRRVLGLKHRTVKDQVAELLLDEADTRREVHLSQSAIAGLLGASRQTVNEALGMLRADQYIATGYRSVRLVDPEGLARVAGRG